jgi:hypothetical protein
MTVRRDIFSIYSVGFLLALLLSPGDCQSEFSLHPGIYLRAEMTDNLYLSETAKNREWIVTVAPNLWLAQQGKLLNLELDYRYELYRFLDEPSLNDRNDTHFWELDGTFLPDRAFSIELQGDARRENIDRRLSDVTDSPAVNTTNRYRGSIRPIYRLQIGARHLIEMAYRYQTVQYDTPLSDDTYSQRVELMLKREQSVRLDLRLEGFHEQLSADINRDYDRSQGMAGGEWRPFTSVTLSAKGGVSWFEYETGEKFNTQVYDCELNYTPSARWAFDASYDKDFDHDIIDGLFEIWRGEVAISYSGRIIWRLGLVSSADEYVQIIREDREQAVVGEISYRLTPKVLFEINADGRRLQLEPVTEEIDRYSIGAAVVFTPREYIETGCHYTYRNSNSDLDFNDYRENRVFCDLQLTYNMIP